MIMQYRVDKYLPRAFKAIRFVKINKKKFADGNVVSKEYKGYISSLGANIIQAGVKAALTFYEAEESGSKQDRRLVNAAIKFIMDENIPDAEYSEYGLAATLDNLTPDEVQQKAEDILDATTALKLALRTCKIE
jgi:hypothetical protein